QRHETNGAGTASNAVGARQLDDLSRPFESIELNAANRCFTSQGQSFRLEMSPLRQLVSAVIERPSHQRGRSLLAVKKTNGNITSAEQQNPGAHCQSQFTRTPPEPPNR